MKTNIPTIIIPTIAAFAILSPITAPVYKSSLSSSLSSVSFLGFFSFTSSTTGSGSGSGTTTTGGGGGSTAYGSQVVS